MFKAKRLLARSIALLVITALSISMMPVFSLSYSETGDISDEKPVQNEYCEDPDLSGDMDGLRYIDSAEIERQGFIRRLKEKESLNSYAFLHRDGTESVVLFPDNIKYVDESGEIVEKDTAIVGNPSGGFTVKANDYGVLFPESIKDGLQFEYLEGCISMIPDGAGGEYTIEDNSISYLNVFGENTILRYTPLLNGIKEDIVINGYSGINSFGFDIRSGNLRFSDKGTGCVLVNENGEPVIEFGDVIVCDSKGKLSAGTLLIEKNAENSYHLTVGIPEEFLTDPETVYPVTIDPTIYESSDGSYIQDSPIFDGASYQNSNFGYYLADYVGLVSSYGNARTAMRLYGLENHPIYKTLDAEEIVSVKISVKGTTSGSPVFVNLYRISSDVTWDESTVTYNNVGSFDTSVNKGAYLSTTQRTEFDITSFAKGWKNLSYTNTMRVIFTASSGTSTWFYSSHPMNNAGTVDNRPYVIFTYQIKNLMEEGTYYIRNRHIDRFLQPVNGSSSANAGLELNAFTGSDTQKWEVISRGNGYYTIKNVYNGYVLSVPSGSYSTYDVQLIQASDTQADGQLWRIYMTSYCGFAIKPKSACGPNDGTGWSDRTMSVADGNDGNGALVTQRPYVYNNSFKDEWYLMPIDISETVNYEIENSQLGSYLRPEDGYTYINNALELWEYLNSYSQKWKFTSAGDGYYKISPYYNSTIAVTIASGSETAENGGVIQYTYSSDNNRQKWFIYKVPHGYALKAKSAGINNLVLSVSEGNLGNGAVVSQRAYVNNLSYKEEWILHKQYSIQSIVDIYTNQTLTLSVQGAGSSSVAWSSSNSNIVSINGSGIISGVNIGSAVVTATVIDPADFSIIHLSCTVNVILHDGVYSIRNDYSNKYLDSIFVSIAETIKLRQYQLRSYDNLITQFWRITYISNGQYSISPYYYNDIFVGCDNDKAVFTNNTGTIERWKFETKDNCLVIRNALTGNCARIEDNSLENNAFIVVEAGSNYISNKWIFEIKTVGPAGIVFFDDDGFNCYSPTIRDVLPGQSKTLSEIGMTVSVFSISGTHSNVTWSSSFDLMLPVHADGSFIAFRTGLYTVTATATIGGVDYSNSYNVKVGYKYGITVQNAYPASCEMRNGNHASFGLYGSKFLNELSSNHTNLFYYTGSTSDVNDLKNKNLPGATHTYANMDDVDLMIYTGHGYAKNRNQEEGEFVYNSLHFGLNTGQPSHAFGAGNISAANYTTLDAINFGNGTRTKWLVTYTCNFLNTEQQDSNVFNILSNGGRLVLGLGSKSYIVAQEGEDFAWYLNHGYTIANAFFQAGHKNQDSRTNLSKKLYRVLYYGPENGGTLDDTMMYPLNNVDYVLTRYLDEIVNPNGTAFQLD